MPEAAEEREVLAGEFALGVLEGEELSAAQRLMLASHEFADDVEWWRLKLGCMAEEARLHVPRDGLWPAIERRLAEAASAADRPSPPAAAPAPGYSAWSLGAAMSGAAAIAAGVTFFFAEPAPSPDPVAPPPPIAGAGPGERLVAQSQSEEGAISLAGIVDRDAGSLTLNVSGLQPDDGEISELWIVPEGGAPRSLGPIPQDGEFARDLDAEERALLRQGSALAITYEEAVGVPHAAPTSDILIVAPLSRV